MRLAATTCALLLCIAACSDGEPSASSSATPAPTVTVTELITERETVTVTVPEAPSPAPVSELSPLGTTAEVGPTELTVFGYQQPVATDGPQPETPGDAWAAADVQVCAVDGPLDFFPSGFSVVDSQQRGFEPSSVGYSSFPEPNIFQADIAAGECTRGYVIFVVRADAQIEAIRYRTADGGATWSPS